MAFAKEKHLYLRSFGSTSNGQIAVGNALANRVAIVRTGDVTEHPVTVQDWFLAHDHDVAVIKRQAAEPAHDSLPSAPFEGSTAQEVALVEADRETDAGLVGVVFGMDVGAPEAAALLEAQGVERATTRRDHAERSARRAKRVPEMEAVFGGRVDFPTQFAHVGDAQSQGGDVVDEDALSGVGRKGG